MRDHMEHLTHMAQRLSDSTNRLNFMLADIYDAIGDNRERPDVVRQHVNRLKDVESLAALYERIEGRLYRAERNVHEHINTVESELAEKLDAIKEQILANKQTFVPTRCVYAEDKESIEGGIARFILSGGSSLQAQDRGKREFAEEMRSWLTDAEEIALMDPYLFKRSRLVHSATGKNLEENILMHAIAEDTKYVNRLIEIVGPKKRKVSFFYDSDHKNHLTPAVLNIFTKQIAKVATKPFYYASDKIHDRVWLRKRSKTWEARVIGTSLDGIGKRPTYVMQMEHADVKDYLKYINYLKKNSIQSRDEPITKKD